MCGGGSCARCTRKQPPFDDTATLSAHLFLLKARSLAKRISLRRFAFVFDDDSNKAATKNGPANTQFMATMVDTELVACFIQHDINNANTDSAQDF